MEKSQKGITMVSLIVTIIVLIILASISIQVTIGENGIITKAKQTKKNILLAGEAEALQLNQLYYELETGGDLSGDEEGNKKDEIISLLQKQVAELQKQVVSLQTENADLKKQIETLAAKITNLQKEIEDLKKQIENKDIEITELKKQISEKEAKIQELQNQLNNINSILSQTDATADKILAGYRAYSTGKLLTGTMVNRGAVSNTLNCGQSYMIPTGYHNGAGKVTANSLASQTQATATASDIISGKSAWVNGNLITGQATASNNSYTLPAIVLSTHYGQSKNTDIYLPLKSINNISFKVSKTSYGKVSMTLQGDVGEKSLYADSSRSAYSEKLVEMQINGNYNYLYITAGTNGQSSATITISEFTAKD